jgi:hypothetical protein
VGSFGVVSPAGGEAMSLANIEVRPQVSKPREVHLVGPSDGGDSIESRHRRLDRMVSGVNGRSSNVASLPRVR